MGRVEVYCLSPINDGTNPSGGSLSFALILGLGRSTIWGRDKQVIVGLGEGRRWLDPKLSGRGMDAQREIRQGRKTTWLVTAMMSASLLNLTCAFWQSLFFPSLSFGTYVC